MAALGASVSRQAEGMRGDVLHLCRWLGHPLDQALESVELPRVKVDVGVDREHVDAGADACLEELGDLFLRCMQVFPVPELVVRLSAVTEERPGPAAVTAPAGNLERGPIDLLRLLVPVFSSDVVGEIELGPE